MVYATAEPDRALIGQRSDAIMADLQGAQHDQDEKEEALDHSVPGLLDNPDAPYSGAGLFGLSPQQSLDALVLQVRRFARDTPERVGYVPLAYLQRDMSTGPALLQHLVGATADLPAPERTPASATDGAWARVGPPGGAPPNTSLLRTDEFMRHLQRSPGAGSSSPTAAAVASNPPPPCHIVTAGSGEWTVVITPQDIVTVGASGKVVSSYPSALVRARGGDVQLVPQQAAPATPSAAPADHTAEARVSDQTLPSPTASHATVAARAGPGPSSTEAAPRPRLQLRIKSISSVASTAASPRAQATMRGVQQSSPHVVEQHTRPQVDQASHETAVHDAKEGAELSQQPPSAAPSPRVANAGLIKHAAVQPFAAPQALPRGSEATPPATTGAGTPGTKPARAPPLPPSARGGDEATQRSTTHPLRSTSPAVVDVRPTSFSPTAQGEPRPGAVAAAVAVAGQRAHLTHMHRERVLTAWTMESLQQQVHSTAPGTPPAAVKPAAAGPVVAVPSPRLAVTRRLQAPGTPTASSHSPRPLSNVGADSLDGVEEFLSGVRSRLQ